MQNLNDYRSIYCRLSDDLDFQALHPNAKLLWFVMRTCHECGPTGIYRFYASQFAERTGLDLLEVTVRVGELEAAGYVVQEQGHVLMVNAMKYEPCWKPTRDPKHLKATLKLLEPLRRLAISRKLLQDNDIAWPDEWSQKPLRRAIEAPTKGHRSTETETDPETETETDEDSAPAAGPRPSAAEFWSRTVLQGIASEFIERYGRPKWAAFRRWVNTEVIDGGTIPPDEVWDRTLESVMKTTRDSPVGYARKVWRVEIQNLMESRVIDEHETRKRAEARERDAARGTGPVAIGSLLGDIAKRREGASA